MSSNGITSDAEVISGLNYTMRMICFNPLTGEVKDPDTLNEADKTTYDACAGAIELLTRYGDVIDHMEIFNSTKEYKSAVIKKIARFFKTWSGDDDSGETAAFSSAELREILSWNQHARFFCEKLDEEREAHRLRPMTTEAALDEYINAFDGEAAVWIEERGYSKTWLYPATLRKSNPERGDPNYFDIRHEYYLVRKKIGTLWRAWKNKPTDWTALTAKWEDNAEHEHGKSSGT